MNALRPTWIPLLAVAACSSAAVDDAGEDDDHDDRAAWADAYEQVALGKADYSGCSGVVVPDQSGFDKRVALTFDDGPNPETTPQVLDILAARGIKATFFINGNKVNSNAARAALARTLEDGHRVGNHSQTHKDFKKMGSSAEMRDAVLATQQVQIESAFAPRWFRFPYGSATCSAMNIVDEIGLTVVGWHVDSGDWCYKNNDGYCTYDDFEHIPDSFRHDMHGYTLSQIRARRGGIVLFHDIHQFTVNHLDSILDTLENEGYTFVNIDDVATFPLLNGITPPFIGDVCANDSQCSFEGGRCHRFSPTSGGQAGFCTRSCQGTCPDQLGKAPTFCTSLDSGASGSCVAKSSQKNHECADIPGTAVERVARFVGSSGAAPASADVCWPN